MISSPDRPILVVGASGTIGGAVASALGNAGHTLGLQYCSGSGRIESIRRLLPDAVQSHAMQSGLESIEACDALVSDFVDKTGGLYGIALCGGRVPWKPWQESAGSDWLGAYFEHCVAPFALARAAAQRIPEGGRIVYLSSIAAKYGGSVKTMHYAAAKAGLEAAMRGLARELAPRGILVNGVRAGYVDSPQHEQGRSPEEISARIARIPLRRAGLPEEVASGFAYLFSRSASFTTGDTITVAGGD
jgi:NAD(P)-dependent dehydrogenase (short-subunit alcohol dehydrogenase family)